MSEPIKAPDHIVQAHEKVAADVPATEIANQFADAMLENLHESGRRKVRVRTITCEDAAKNLEDIFDDIQTRFHDEWDWIRAAFSLEVLMTTIRGFQETPTSTIPIAAASEGVKRPHQRAHGDVERGFKSCYAQDEADAYITSLKSQLAAKDAEIEQLKVEVVELARAR
jgi:hypothetical protein